MTKRRAPVTIENTLFRVLGALSIERSAEITGRSVNYLRALSDPDKRERLTIDDAAALDLAWRDAGHEGFPLYETFGLILEAAAATRFADADALARRIPRLVRETAEAIAASAVAAQPGAGAGDRREACRELEEAIAEANVFLRLLSEPATLSVRGDSSPGSQAAPPPLPTPLAAAAVADGHPPRAPP